MTAPTAPPNWTFAVGNWNALPDTELSRATGRSATWRLGIDHEAAFTLDGTLPETAGVNEMIDDLWIYRNGATLFRGRVGASSDTLDGTAHTVTFGAGGYRSLLQRRYLYEGDTIQYLNKDTAAIAWGLLGSTQAKAGGSLNIVQGVGFPMGVTIVETDYNPGQSVGGAIDQLASVPNGFEWDITPRTDLNRMTFDIYHPYRGQSAGRIVDYPGQIQSLTRAVDPSTFANALRATGADGLAAVRVEEPGIAADPAGRWDTQYGDTNIVVPATLASIAAQQLVVSQFIAPSYSLVLQPNAWGGPSDIWIGDVIVVSIRSGRLNVIESLRVIELSVALSDDGVETVTLTVGQPPPYRKWLLRRFDARLVALERR